MGSEMCIRDRVILGLNVVDVLVVPLEEGVALLSAVLGCELDVDLVGGLD